MCLGVSLSRVEKDEKERLVYEDRFVVRRCYGWYDLSGCENMKWARARSMVENVPEDV